MNELIKRLIEAFNELPGIGEKSAERIVFYLLDKPEERLSYFIERFKELKEKIKICSLCNNFDEEDPCKICRDERRDNVLMIVPTPKEVWTFEKTGEFNGRYFVLGGLISPLENIYPEDLKLNSLFKILKEKKVEEIIFAFPPLPEGEVTIYFLIDKLKGYNFKMTKFRSGIPLGITFDYLDNYTLREVLKNREVIELK
ncbi:MAG: recombination mediator RecR [candidate division WOR-3 bacterium]